MIKSYSNFTIQFDEAPKRPQNPNGIHSNVNKIEKCKRQKNNIY